MDRFAKGLKMQYEKTFIHPEEDGNDKLNNALSYASGDIKAIDNSLKEIADKTNTLLEKTVDRLDIVKEIIQSEKERLQDISMLCNANTDYDNVIPIKDSDLTGDLSYEDGVFFSKLNNSSMVKAKINEVAGNGYEGNKYVRGEKGYLENTINSESRIYATDNNISTYWEYSRVTAANTEEYLVSDFNTDNAEAKCTATLIFATMANEIAIKSSLDKTKIIGIKYSVDGINYEDIDMLPITINDKDESYKNQDYIYGSNILSFPSSKSIKITFESTGYLNEVLSFERVITDNNEEIEKVTTIVPTAKRHVIRINDIAIKAKTYRLESTSRTQELITKDDEIYAISIFANSYFPKGVPDTYIKYVLTVNGIDYEVQPVNSNKNGTKIIRFSQGKMPNKYTKYIGEKIQSAYLTIYMKSKNQLTPYMNNLKVLLGGEV